MVNRAAARSRTLVIPWVYRPYQPSLYGYRGGMYCWSYFSCGWFGTPWWYEVQYRTYTPAIATSVGTGSLRLRVSPAQARVYVNDVFVGLVEEFNGLSNHLKLTEGEHMVEIRLEGYVTFVPEFTVTIGRTTTIRGTLKAHSIK